MAERRTAAIEVDGPVKSYGAVLALDGLDVRVEAETVLGFLGPNGAGKTRWSGSWPP